MRRAIFFFFLVANVNVAQQPLFRVVDLDVGATERVQVSDGKSATVNLLSTSETRDRVRSAIRDARVDVEINGRSATLSCGNYRLPVAAGGVQVDCEVTKAYYRDTNADHWALAKVARLRPLTPVDAKRLFRRSCAMAGPRLDCTQPRPILITPAGKPPQPL
jgi:hypothetical protein